MRPLVKVEKRTTKNRMKNSISTSIVLLILFIVMMLAAGWVSHPAQPGGMLESTGDHSTDYGDSGTAAGDTSGTVDSAETEGTTSTSDPGDNTATTEGEDPTESTDNGNASVPTQPEDAVDSSEPEETEVTEPAETEVTELEQPPQTSAPDPTELRLDSYLVYIGHNTLRRSLPEHLSRTSLRSFLGHPLPSRYLENPCLAQSM